MRAAEERLQLSLAAGAARERLYVAPRLELSESRPRVPWFYVLDIVRAIEGAIPSATRVAERAYAAGGSRLAWPAPDDPARAIDAFEHDLASLGRLLAEPDASAVRGRARYSTSSARSCSDRSPHDGCGGSAGSGSPPTGWCAASRM
ncbi:MAG: hypothetical protein R2712_09730 [Vicinamibacterales bacterium]